MFDLITPLQFGRLPVRFLGVVALFIATAAAQEPYDHAAIGYLETEPVDAVSRLNERIAAGETELTHETKFGYLRSLLRELDVSESSQMLVFSKTSLQRSRISSRTPRAIYFNDEVSVGFCRDGDVLEVTATDPRLGPVFYTLDQTDPRQPAFTRQTESCLVCHASSTHTDGVPGHLVRSLYVDAGGYPLLAFGSLRTEPSSPFAERWGGWYVTGTHGEATHRGNHVVRDQAIAEQIDPQNLNVTDLADRFDTAGYLTPHSDLVALMVFEHQAAVQNAITTANHLTRRALWDNAVFNKAFGEPAEQLRESTTRRIDNAAEPLVRQLLCSGEAELTSPVAGTSGFADEFAARGPHDGTGRSLRQLDLKSRLFRYPCSYLIYSDAFAGLPEPVREQTLQRLWEVLSGEDESESFAHLSSEDRTAILEILRNTLPNLPAYWHGAGE